MNFNNQNKNILLKNKRSVFILDTFRITFEFREFFNKILPGNNKIVVNQNIPKNIDYNYLIIPYFLSELNNEKSHGNNIISGKNALIINQQLFNKKKIVNNKKFKIYINMGATDKKKFSLKILKILKHFYDNKDFEIYIVIGPFFKRELKKKIITYKKKFKNIIISNNQKNYIQIMKKCSLAIINSGNIKYEISCIGKPFILLSNDETSKKFCKFFTNQVYCDKFGDFEIPNELEIKKYIYNLKNNFSFIKKKFMNNKNYINDSKIKYLCQKIEK